jgi:hypothetical protein
MTTYFPITASDWPGFPESSTLNSNVTFMPNVPVGTVVVAGADGYVSAPTQAQIVAGVLQSVSLLAQTEDLNITGTLQYTATFWESEVDGQTVTLAPVIFNASTDTTPVDLLTATPVAATTVTVLPTVPIGNVTGFGTFGLELAESTNQAAALALLGLGADVIEASTLSAFPGTGVVNQLYYTQDTHEFYIWTGSAYQAAGGGGASVPSAGMVKSNGTALVDATAGTDFVAPGGALGTPSSGNASNLTSFPTFNQSTTGNAATATKWATARKVSGASLDGSANISLLNRTLQTSAYTAAANDLVICNPTAAMAVTLPTAPTNGTLLGIKNLTTWTVTYTCGGSDVLNVAAGSTSGTLTYKNQGVLLEYDASSSVWTVVSDDIPPSALTNSTGRQLFVDNYGSDPTGTNFSDTAVAAAVAALGSSAGSIVFGPGTYKLNNSVGTFGAGQSIIGAGRGATTLSFHGTGDVMWVKGTSATTPPAAGVIYGLTIDGSNAGTGSPSAGIHAGDIFGLKIDNVQVQNFTATGSKGLWFDDRVAWMERADINAIVNFCTTAVLFDGSSQANMTWSSFDYGRYWFSLVLNPNQNGVTLNGNAALAGVEMRIVANPLAGTTNTGAVLTVGTTGTDLSFIGQGTTLDISAECDGTSGQVGHAAINVGADAYLIASGSLNFANYVTGLAFKPGTISGVVAFTTLSGQNWGGTAAASRWNGSLAPCQVVAVGSETFTVASGSVTQIAGTAVNGYSPVPGDRILIVNAPASTGAGTASGISTQPTNGIYVCTNNTTNLSLSRAADMAWSIPNGLSTYVENGSTFAGQCTWTVVSAAGGAFTYGTSTMKWAVTGGVNPPTKKLVSEYAGTTSLSSQAFPTNINGASPTGVLIDVMISPGTGGGSGRRGAASTIRCGGGGGSSGGVLHGVYIPAADFGGNWSLTIPAGGAGGAAVTVDSTNGNNGSAAGSGSVIFTTGSYNIIATSGDVGYGGTATTGNGSSYPGGSGFIQGNNGQAASTTGGPGVSYGPTYGLGGPGGGSSGGGITSGNVAGAGAAGSASPYYVNATGGSAGVVDSTTPTSPAAVAGAPGNSAGSGAASITTVAQSGAAGLGYGVGGAGGGASLNGHNSGAGGVGGPGFVRLIWDYA